MGVAGVAVTLLALQVAGWGLVAASAAGSTLALGIGATAYLLGVRHAFDADHIAAIDNVARRLRGAGRRSWPVGFWFSLGHSSVVVATVALLSLGAHAVVGAVRDAGPVRAAASTWGTGVSIAFVLAFGLVNLGSLVALLRGRSAGASGGGALFRLLGRAVQVVDRPARMYPVGLLFALGLDTAGTVALLVTAGAASPTLPWTLTVAVPVLFTAGMTLGDTADGVFMDRLYGWAADAADRRRRALVVVTAISVLAAFVVVAVEVGGLVPTTAFGELAEAVGFEGLGFAIAGVFAAVGMLAVSRTLIARRPVPSGAVLPASSPRRLHPTRRR